MQCHHFDAHRCRSCALLDIPYERQLATKAADVHALLGEYPDLDWLPPVASAQAGFRNKAKMAVSGTADNPILGILDASFGGVDLRDCPLYTQGMQEVLDAVRAFIMAARIEPYRVADRRGELKYVLVTESPDSEYMVRFVARSQEPVTRISKHLPGWLAENPQVRVVTVNLQPEHKAILEGDREIVLTKDNSLTMRVGDIPLYLRPQSFFQTNTPLRRTCTVKRSSGLPMRAHSTCGTCSAGWVGSLCMLRRMLTGLPGWKLVQKRSNLRAPARPNGHSQT